MTISASRCRGRGCGRHGLLQHGVETVLVGHHVLPGRHQLADDLETQPGGLSLSTTPCFSTEVKVMSTSGDSASMQRTGSFASSERPSTTEPMLWVSMPSTP